MNLYDYLMGVGKPSHPAIITPEGPTTYGALAVAADAVATALRSLGVQPADRVALLARNSPFWVASYLGIIKLGAVAMPLPARLSPAESGQMLALTGCTAICVERGRLSTVAPALAPGTRIVVPPAPGGPPERIEGHRVLVAVRDAGLASWPVQPRTDLAALMFTSGSTGAPNGVKVSHRNIAANTAAIIGYLGLSAADKMLVVLPFDYCFGASLLHTHLRAGGSLVLNNAPGFFENVVDDIERYACTGIAGVPSFYQQMLRRSSLPRRAVPSLRHAQQAGGRLPPALVDEFVRALPHVRFYTMYGQTEATARLSYLPPEQMETKRGSIGRGIPGVTLRVERPDGTAVAPGEEGEVVAAGESITLGYWTEDTGSDHFRAGRLYTGDLATVDADGYIYLRGRASDFIKPNGHRIACRQIEDVLLELPDVVEAAVIGVPDPLLGEVAKAYVVTRSGAPLPLELLQTHCRRRLKSTPYAVPRDIVFIDALPKSDRDKVLKRLLATQSGTPPTPQPTPQPPTQPGLAALPAATAGRAPFAEVAACAVS